MSEREDLAAAMAAAGEEVQGVEFSEELAAREEQFGAPKGLPGQWASCLRIVEPANLTTLCVKVGGT